VLKLKHKVLTGITFLVWAFLMLVLFERSPLQAGWKSQSVLPSPPRPTNPHFVPSVSGGRIYCGLQQSSVWLDVPEGFMSEGGAEFHCDRMDSLSQWIGTFGAWDDRGYLVAFYPIQAPIIKPFFLVFEIDPARAGDICSGCFSARYYDAASRQWQGLPTTYDTTNWRIYVEIAEFLSACEYPGYTDRFLITLFVREAKPTSAPTIIYPSLTAVPTPASTPVPKFSPALSPSPSPALATMSPIPPSTLTPIPTFSPTPTLSPFPTLVSMSPTPSAVSKKTSVPVSLPSESSQPSPDTALVILVLLLATIVLVLLVTVVLVYKQRKLEKD
jgi:hypothetical protein